LNAAQRRGLDPMPEFLRSDIPDQMEGTIRAAVRVTVEARDAAAGFVGAAIAGLVELLLRKGVSSSRSPSICLG